MENETDIQSIVVKASRLLRTADGLQRQIDEIKKQYLPTEGGYKQLWHGVKPIGTKLMVLLVCIMIMGCLGGIFTALAQTFFFQLGFPVDFAVWLSGIVQVVLVALALVLVQEHQNKKIVVFNQENAQRLERNRLRNRELAQKELELRTQLNAVGVQYHSECSEYIPQDYRYNMAAVDFFAKAMVNRRADSIKEAVNLYETEMYRKRMEAKQDAMIRKQEEANQLAAANRAASIATAAAVNRQADAAYCQAAAMNRQADELSRINSGY